MPPFHSRSAGARRIARTSVGGSRFPGSTSRTSAARADTGIAFMVRGKTPPPSLISDSS